MNAEMQVHLHKVRLFGYHGLNAGEDLTGGEFEVSLTADYIPMKIPIERIEQTLDYTALLSILKIRMESKACLLETLATEVATEIIEKFEMVTAVNISIYKLNPPIKNFQGSVGVTFTLKRK